MVHTEYDFQVALCNYLNLQYPKVNYFSDTIASIQLSKSQARRNKNIQKSGFKLPDLIILEPRKNFCGLLLELKIETPFKKNGEIKASQNDHLKLQHLELQNLSQKGYKALFVWNFEMAKEVIDEYLN